MKTTYYTFTAKKDGAMAAGFDSAAGGGCRTAQVCGPEQKVRTLGGDNIIDLAVWRAENMEGAQEGLGVSAWEDGTPDAPGLAQGPARRVRRSHKAMIAAELASTVSVAAVFLALTIRVLMF